jgi:cysteinyl-tRNA synthetase
VQPRATDHIAQMIAIIERLIASGHAYAADGHVLFDVPSMPTYGGLSRRSLDEMLAGARVDVAPYKRGDMDFVLWKPSKENEPGWDSPWGRGRPGWHIECSAMSWAHLGETFDIHGGGIDLVFPHHENEIAQSCCAFDREVMANYWMHNGFLQVEGEKMSKSLGNFITIHELLHTEKFGGRKWPGEVLRLAMLRTHYRQPIDWTVKALEEAETALRRWAEFVKKRETTGDSGAFSHQFAAALADDLNTPLAVSLLHDVFDPSLLDAALKLLGVDTQNYLDWIENEKRSSIDSEAIDSLIAARLAARVAKNWAESDRIRDELAALGVALKDNKDGTTTWEVKRVGWGPTPQYES